MATDIHPNQFALLRQRRFAPFFWTQFLNAGNDNLFKWAFAVMITYQIKVSLADRTLTLLHNGNVEFTEPAAIGTVGAGPVADA